MSDEIRIEDLAAPVLNDAHRYLLDHGGDVSFWENGWLRHQIGRWGGG